MFASTSVRPTVGPLDPSTPVREFDRADDTERCLAEAVDQRRGTARDRVGSWIDAIDLATTMASHRDPDLQHGRLTTAGLAALAADAALDQYLASYDLADERRGAGATRLVHTAAGRDENRLPDPDMLVTRTSPYGPQRVNPARIAEVVGTGGSFAVKGLDDTFEWLSRWCGEIEHLARVRTSVLGYLGGREARGWGPHFDNHNVLVVQIVGEKSWTVHRPAELRPLLPHSRYVVSGDVAWSGTLRPGDALFIPRGWGHEVRGTEAGSFHVTMPLRSLTAGQVLEMAVANSSRVTELLHDVARGNVPDLTPLASVLRSGTAASALAARRARVPSRSRIGFSEAMALRAHLDRHDVPADEMMQVSAPGGVYALAHDRDEDRRGIAIAGHRIDVDDATAAVVARLVAGPARYDVLADRLPRAPLDALLGDLLRCGLLAHPPDESPPAAATRTISGATRPRRRSGVSVSGEPWPATTVRSLSHHDPWERELALSQAEAHRRSASWLRDSIGGFDLAAELRSTRAPRFRAGHLRADALGVLDGAAGIGAVLARHDRHGAKLVVARGGSPHNVPAPDSTFVPAYSVTSPTLVHTDRLAALLNTETTAILLGIDEVVPSISRFVEQLERVGHRRSGANAYVSRGAAPGFGAHWDDHDVLIIQVAGRKRWEVYAPAEPLPLRPHSAERVSTSLVWEADVEVGDVLYLPRGWGHRVVGLPDLSAHLTFPLRAMNAAAILASGVTGPEGVVGRAGAPLVRLESAPSVVIDRATAYWRGRVPARVHQSVFAADRLLSGDIADAVELTARLGCAGAVAVEDAQGHDRRAVALGGRRVDVPETVGPLLARLLVGTPVTVGELADAASGLELEAVVDAVGVLAVAGLVEVSDPSAGH